MMMNNLFRRTKETFYDAKMKQLLSTININTLPEIVEEVHLFEKEDVSYGSLEENKLYCFKNGNTYDLYYNRIQIHMEDSDNDKSVQIYISAEDNSWAINHDIEGKWQTDSPYTDKFRVYVWQYLRYLSGHGYDDEMYSPGSWNRYVYTGIEAILNTIKSCQECVKYDNIFKNC